MKRVAILIVSVAALLLLIVFVVLTQNKTSTVPYLHLPTLTAQKEQDRYFVRISQSGEKEKTISFSEDRKVLKAKGVEPLNGKNIQIFAGMDLTEVVARYGNPHADIGSGFSIPAYITDDAYLLCFQWTPTALLLRSLKKTCCKQTVLCLDEQTLNPGAISPLGDA